MGVTLYAVNMSSPRLNLGHLLCTQNKVYNIFIERSQVSFVFRTTLIVGSYGRMRILR